MTPSLSAHRPDESGARLHRRSRTVRCDGVDLAVHELGDPARPTVLLVHGWPDTHRVWRQVADRGLAYYRDNLLHGLRPDARPRERRTDVPVLQVELTRDPAVRRASLTASDPWCSDLRRTSLRVGHWAPRTHPDLVAREISGLVRETGE